MVCQELEETEDPQVVPVDWESLAEWALLVPLEPVDPLETLVFLV